MTIKILEFRDICNVIPQKDFIVNFMLYIAFMKFLASIEMLLLFCPLLFLYMAAVNFPYIILRAVLTGTCVDGFISSNGLKFNRRFTLVEFLQPLICFIGSPELKGIHQTLHVVEEHSQKNIP